MDLMEDESSLDQFWNNIRLGQWEVAVAILQPIKRKSVKQYINLLLELILYPDKYSHGSNSIETPFHLSQLALNHLLQDYNGDIKKIPLLPPEYEHKLEFSILLLQIASKTSTSVVQELSLYHNQHILNQHEMLPNISVQLSEFISELITCDPLLSVHITDAITSSHNQIHEINNLIISQLFCNQMVKVLATSKNEDEKGNLHMFNLFLKHLNLQDETFSTDLQTQQDLLLKCSEDDLLMFYMNFIHQEYPGFSKILDDNEASCRLKQISFDENDVINTAEYVSKKLQSNFQDDWCNLFLISYNTNTHLLHYLVNGCCELVEKKEFERLQEILSNVPSIIPLILLQSWSNCKDFYEAIALLNCLTDIMSGSEFGGLFGSVCKQLVYQTKLIDWCLQKTREILGVDYDGGPMVNHLFKQMNSSSVISVLNGASLLKTLKFEEVVELLEKKPAQETSNDDVDIEKNQFLSFSILKKFYNLIIATYIGYIIEDDGVKVPFTNQLICNYMTEIKNNIFQINDLSLRFEVLENIFSMLFIRSSDLQNQNQEEDIDSDIIEETRSLNSSSISQSIDSLSTLGDEAIELCSSSTPSRKLNANQSKNVSKSMVESLLEEMQQSSTDTLKAPSIPSNTKIELSFPRPTFLVNKEILVETFKMIDECLMKISRSKFKENVEVLTEVNEMVPSVDRSLSPTITSNIDNKMSRLGQYLREAQWRFQLIGGTDNDKLTYDTAKGLQHHFSIVNDMLGSAENLVYLTLRKGEIIQANQVIKLFNLKDKYCCVEVDFIMNFQKSKEQIYQISKVSAKEEVRESNLSSIRSATKSSKVSYEVTELVEVLFQHEYLQNPMFSHQPTAVCLDLLFSESLSFNICKSLLESADIKLSQCPTENLGGNVLERQIKFIKSLLQYITTRNLKFFELTGSQTPKDFLSLSKSLPNKFRMSELEFHDSKLSQGLLLFEDLSHHVDYLQASDEQDLKQLSDGKLSLQLKEKASTLFSIFNAETLAQLNKIPSVYEYFKSLLRYVDKLASWEITWTKKKEKNLDDDVFLDTNEPLNPFSIFSENLSTICGNLIFNLEMPPKKLESFTHYIGLNLVKIIAENCGIKYSSFKITTYNRREVDLLLKSPIILNTVSTEAIEINKSPNVVVEELLSSLLEMVSESQEYSPSNLIASEVCQMMGVACIELTSIDMNMIKTNSEKLAFFINLFNLLYTHGMMMILAGKLDFSIELDASKLSLLLHSPTFRLVLQKLFCYQIGDIGVLSAYDIYDKFLCGGLTERFFGTSCKGEINSNIQEDWIPLFDYRCLFCLSFGTLDSPLIKVVHPSSLEEVLQRNMLDFLDDHMGIDVEKKEIFLPEILHLHDSMFMQHLETIDFTSEEERLKALLTCISEIPRIPTKLSDELKLAIDELFEVDIEPHDWNLRRSLSHKSSFSFNESFSESLHHFPVVPPSISIYLSDNYPMIGSLIEIALRKSQMLKDTKVIYDSNLLSRGSNKNESLVDMLPSLQHSLANFTKIASNYKPLKHFLLESSSIFIRFIKMMKTMERSLSDDFLEDLYTSSRELLSRVFLLSLSPNDWLSIFPSLFSCSLYCNMCHKLVESNLELISFLPPHLNDLLLLKAVDELQSQFCEVKSLNECKKTLCLKYCMYKIYDSHIRYKIVLQHCCLLDVNDAEDLLKLCLHDDNLLAEEKEVLNKRYEEVHWLNQVLVSMLSSTSVRLMSWQQVEEEIQVDPTTLVMGLVDVKAFSILDKWCELYAMPDDLFILSTQAKIIDLLEEENTSSIDIQTVLDQIKSKENCLKVCENILRNKKLYNCKHLFILQYITTSLASLVNNPAMKDFMYRKLVILSIGLIPEEFQSSFTHFQDKPLLVVEQLLMNVKVNIAKSIIVMLHKEAAQHPTYLPMLISECDDLIAKYATKSLTLPTTLHLPVKSLPQSPSKSSMEKESQEFSSPLQSVDKRKWIPDGLASICMICNESFNMFNRRHHCRHCGRVVCAACSNHFYYIPRYKRKERVCESCFRQNYKKDDENTKEGSNVHNDSFHHPLIIKHDELVYTLLNDDVSNKQFIDEFTFEQSPSASLCLAIIDLYSNQRAAGGLLLQFSNKLSSSLKVEKKQEVDVTMIAGMIEFILKHAKLKFMKTGDFSGVELCDTHLARVEILKLLLVSNWEDVPSMQELTRPESLRRLRDKLVEDERYTLAIEVTNKCGLNVTPVFFKMGLSKLKYGNLEKARELFARCLTVTPNDSTKSFTTNTHNLDRIVEVIESLPFIACNHLLLANDNQQQQQQQPPFSNTLQEYFKSSVNEYGMDKRRYDEIYYYLTTYGSHSHVISFLLRHLLIYKAVEYVKTMKCPVDVFISCLLVPSFQDGYFDTLCENMRLNDATLRSWLPFLTEACKHLSKHNLYHCLYELQLYIKDYYRAALTCVRFYLGTTAGQPATCFKDLYRRIKYLQLANQHLDNLLKERHSRSSFVSHVGSSFLNEDSNKQQEPTSEIKRYSNTINLQLSVMDYLFDSKYLLREERCEEKVPTLFGNGKERAELAIKLLVISVEDSLPLASRIIQDFKLPSSAIFGRTCKRLAANLQNDEILTLLRNIEQNGMLTSKEKDEILLVVIKVIARTGQIKNANPFIKLVKTDTTKITALMVCGRLREAYLEAVKKERATEIQRILDEAKQMANQKSMVDICEKWLKGYYEKQSRINAITPS